MRISPKQLMVKAHVGHTLAFFKGKFCKCCDHLVKFERMYTLKDREDHHYCTTCYKSREEVYDDVFVKEVTAQDIVIRNEKRALNKTLENVISDIHELPDGEVSPSVHSVVMKHSISLGLGGYG